MCVSLEVPGDDASSTESTPPSSADEDNTATCCSTTPQPAVLGIGRVWVHPAYRRKHIASRLIDAARYPCYTFFNFFKLLSLFFFHVVLCLFFEFFWGWLQV